jgi:hypothetical protein
MEHLQAANGHGRASVFGTILTFGLGLIAKLTASDVLVYVSIGAGLMTMGFTGHKWYLMIKRGKDTD